MRRCCAGSHCAAMTMQTSTQRITIDASALQPMVTFGTNPGMVIGVNDPVPDDAGDASFRKALDYMQVVPGKPMSANPVDVVFVGSCTNGRLSDLSTSRGNSRRT